MYMAPIVRGRTPPSPTMRRIAGGAALPLAAAAMLPFLAGCAVYAAIALAVRSLLHAPQVLVQIIDHAGGELVGR